jgi:hypothetical protein
MLLGKNAMQNMVDSVRRAFALQLPVRSNALAPDDRH